MVSLTKCFSLVFVSIAIFSVRFAASDEFYSLSAVDIQGNKIDFEKFRGKAVLVTNVASECGYTDSHYRAFVKLHSILNRHNKFTILAFPCNQFGNQEPALDHQIELFIRTHFKAEFPMFSKIDVIGQRANNVFKFLAERANQAPDWNFWKYLVNHEGKVTNAWGPQTRVEQIFDIVQSAVEAAETAARNKSEKPEKTDL